MGKRQLVEDIQKRLATAGEDDLYRRIARSVPARVSQRIGGGAALRLKSPVKFGRDVYRKFARPALHAGICGKAQFCKKRKAFDTAAKLTSLVAGFAGEVVSAQFGLPPGVGTGAGLVVDISAAALKEGLNKLCECKKEVTQ